MQQCLILSILSAIITEIQYQVIIKPAYDQNYDQKIIVWMYHNIVIAYKTYWRSWGDQLIIKPADDQNYDQKIIVWMYHNFVIVYKMY